MTKNIYLFTAVIAFFLFHSQIFAQQTRKTNIVSESSLPYIDIPPFVIEYETIPKDSNTYIVAEYNIGIMQDFIEINLDDSIKKYVDLATTDILLMYDADALIGLRTDTSTNEVGEMVVILRGFPIRWTDIKTFEEYYAEKNRSKPKKTYKKGSLGLDLGAGAIIKKEVNISYQILGGSTNINTPLLILLTPALYVLALFFKNQNFDYAQLQNLKSKI